MLPTDRQVAQVQELKVSERNDVTDAAAVLTRVLSPRIRVPTQGIRPLGIQRLERDRPVRCHDR